jgi:hypothetical protein
MEGMNFEFLFTVSIGHKIYQEGEGRTKLRETLRKNFISEF